jgi:hypothetical protein
MLAGKALLTPIQKQVLALFAGLPDQERFFLTGGTALAEFYLGHRLSLDLDLFTSEGELILPFSRQVEAASLQRGLSVTVTHRFTTMVEFLFAHGEETVRMDLALDSPFRLEPPFLSAYGVWVNNLTDLKADKVLAYYGRAEPRDAVDLYFLLQQASKESLLTLAGRKDTGFDLYWFAVALGRALAFPDELERWPVKMLASFNPTELKRTFQEWAMQLLADLTAKR